MPATVPGAVQLDWAKGMGLPELTYGQNVAAYAGLEDFFWLYQTKVPAATLRPDDRLFFFCEGVDFECEVSLGGARVHAHRGLLSGFEIDVSRAGEGTLLEVLIHPAPKRHALPADRSQASHVTKPAVSYGWDWHPRLIPLGLCQRTGFEVRPRAHIRHVDFAYHLGEDLSCAEITVSVECSDPGAGYRWRLWDPAGALVEEQTGPNARLENPVLWWTHDHGNPSRYTLEVYLPSGDTVVRKVGFRRVRLVMHRGAWDHDGPFPRSRENPPITVELNGRQLFIKGTNWVCPDIFHGRVDDETYYGPLLQLARGAHLNMIRCWGGAPAAKEEFFERCDALGLLVWQEFPLACNLYPDAREYLEELDRESRALIKRVRQHPCLALWVGGNELFNSWSRMTDQSLALRLLDRNCFELDRLTPFMPTAPMGGMGHGDYRFWTEGRDVFQIFQGATCTAYSEFGCPGTSPVDYLKTFIPDSEPWPAQVGTSWETHHGLNSWEVDATTWLCTSTVEHFFGKQPNLEEFVAKSTWLQGEGYKAIFEEARRQQPRCSMALNWCFNEPWPCVANNSLVNWPARPKPAYSSVREACRPALLSARIPRFQWKAGEMFSAQLWVLNDAPTGLPAGEARVELLVGGRRMLLLDWSIPPVGAQANLQGPTVQVRIPAGAPEAFILELSDLKRPELSSAYRLSLRAPELPGNVAP